MSADRHRPAPWYRRFLILLLAGLWSAAPAATIEGNWLTDDGKAVIAIGRCDHDICGTIRKILDKGPDVPSTDVRNPDPARRMRPLVGLPILTGFRPSGSAYKGGRAYDPKTGNSYRSTLAMDGTDRLVLTGCVLFFCQSKYWTRLRALGSGQEHR